MEISSGSLRFPWQEGIAPSLAGVIKKHREGAFDKGKTIVCTLAGNGLKGPNAVFKVSGDALIVKSDFAVVRKMIGKIL